MDWEEANLIETAFKGLKQRTRYAPIFDRGNIQDFYEFIIQHKKQLNITASNSTNNDDDSDFFVEDD